MKAPPIKPSTTLELCRIKCTIDMRNIASKPRQSKATEHGESESNPLHSHDLALEAVSLTRYKAVGPNKLEIAWRCLAKNR